MNKPIEPTKPLKYNILAYYIFRNKWIDKIAMVDVFSFLCEDALDDYYNSIDELTEDDIKSIVEKFGKNKISLSINDRYSTYLITVEIQNENYQKELVEYNEKLKIYEKELKEYNKCDFVKTDQKNIKKYQKRIEAAQKKFESKKSKI